MSFMDNNHLFVVVNTHTITNYLNLADAKMRRGK